MQRVFDDLRQAAHGNPWVGALLEAAPLADQLERAAAAATIHPEIQAALGGDHWAEERRHLMVNDAHSAPALAAVRQAVFARALQDLDGFAKEVAAWTKKAKAEGNAAKAPTCPCWLTVTIPVARAITSTGLLHRIIRRLYFEGTLLGLNAHPALRQFMVDLRLAYFQTRGALEMGDERREQQKSKADAKFKLSVTEPLFEAQMGVGEEFELVTKAVATMERLNDPEAEDLLDHNVRRLLAIDLDLADLTGDNAQTYIVAFRERVGGWVRSIKKWFADAQRNFDVRLKVVVILHSLDNLSYAEVVTLSEALRNILVSTPLRFVLVGGLFQELMWHDDLLALQPRLCRHFDHFYLGGKSAVAAPADRDRVARALADWRATLDHLAGQRLLQPCAAPAGQAARADKPDAFFADVADSRLLLCIVQ
jgi:hypothetical protein